MSLSVVPTSDNIFKAVGDYLTDVLPANVRVIQGQINRVPEPQGDEFVVMWPINLPRISTNIDAYLDSVFTGSIAGTLMTITAVNPNYHGQLGIGSPVFGTNVAAGTVVTALGTGSGGVGTYTVAPSQTVTSETLAAGTQSLLQPTEVILQIDVHGDDAWNNAQLVSTTFRDAYAVDFFLAGNAQITPLWCSDPAQRPFLNAEQAWENRFVIELHLEANQTVIVPQQFFTSAIVGVVEVDSAYPPS